MMFASTVFRLV